MKPSQPFAIESAWRPSTVILTAIVIMCSAEDTSVRDQIVIGTINDQIREEALKKSWTLETLRKEGMHMESAAKGTLQIAGDGALNNIGKYSYKNTKKKDYKVPIPSKKVNCYYCGFAAERRDIAAHSRQCPAKSSTCTKCKKVGHTVKVCKSEMDVHEISVDESEEEEPVYNVNIFRLQKRDAELEHQIDDEDFKVQLVINNNLDSVLADTGAKVSVCSYKQARKWNLLDRMTSTKVKIKPYKSQVIPAMGESR